MEDLVNDEHVYCNCEDCWYARGMQIICTCGCGQFVDTNEENIT